MQFCYKRCRRYLCLECQHQMSAWDCRSIWPWLLNKQSNPVLFLSLIFKCWWNPNMCHRHWCTKFQAYFLKTIDKISLIFAWILQVNFYFDWGPCEVLLKSVFLWWRESHTLFWQILFDTILTVKGASWIVPLRPDLPKTALPYTSLAGLNTMQGSKLHLRHFFLSPDLFQSSKK